METETYYLLPRTKVSCKDKRITWTVYGSCLYIGGLLLYAPLDQLVRSSACHAEGQGFESPTVRQNVLPNQQIV